MTGPRVLVFAYRDVGHECLQALLERRANVVAVLTHADEANERVWFRSVAALARAHAIPVHAPENVNVPAWIARLASLAPDLILCFYYRRLIAPEILHLSRLGAFNLHGSLLPKYRGRAPTNWAILHGERETGATLHAMVQRPDAGDIVDQEAVPIGPQDTIREVSTRVTEAARVVLERNLDGLLMGRAPRRPQDETQATYFGGRKPEHGRIDWRRNAVEIFNLVRAVTHPYPGAFTEHESGRFTIWWARPVGGDRVRSPGEVVSASPLRIATGRGSLEVIEWQTDRDARPERGLDHGLRAGTLLGQAS